MAWRTESANLTRELRGLDAYPHDTQLMTLFAEPTSTQRTWTPEQRAAIETTGHSLLVSAAAGSGKTAVLTERCAYLVCDALEPCDVDELLVVTFTEAAAAEMRARVRKTLHTRAATSTDPRVARQLAGVERATIGTLHSFCGRLIRQHFHAAGVDPDFDILDGDGATLMKREVVRDVIAARFAADENEALHALLDGYFNGDDALLASDVLGAYEMLTSLPDPRAWLATSRQRLHEAAGAKALNASHFGRTFLSDVRRELGLLRDRIRAASDAVARVGSFPAYTTALAEAAQVAAHWAATLDRDGVDALAEEVDVRPTKLPGVSNALPGKAVAKQAVDDVRDDMKDGPLRSALKFTEAQWRDGIARTLGPADELLDLVERFSEAYAAAKSRLRTLDFSDLERRSLALLCEEGDPSRPSAVARGCHRRYPHVLVDEYQDINALQESILRLVSRECLPSRNGNLFCVGDVKQSIYRFRSAEPDLFLRRYDRFRPPGSGGKVIDLNANFRSRAPLLDAVNAVFERLMTGTSSGIEYAAGHRLAPGATFPDSGFRGAPIELHLLPANPQAPDTDQGATDGLDTERAEREAAFIVRRIRELMGETGAPRARVATSDGMTLRDLRYGDIAILLRTRKFKIDQYADVLRKSGIPVVAEGGSGFFGATEVLDVLSLLRVLDNFRQDLPLAAVLRSPLGALPEPEDSLARIRLAYPAETVPFHEAVARYPLDHDDELAARLRDALARLEGWRAVAQRRPLAEVVATIYEESGYPAFVCGLDDGEQRRANLLELHRRAAQFGRLEGGASGGGLSRFLSFLEGLADEVDAGQATLTSRSVDAVRIVTIHKSKGLEFPVVVVADLGKTFNLTDCRGPILYDKDEGLGLQVADEDRLARYPSLATTVIEPRVKRKMLAEELRVLYVALTRAKEHLILVGTPKDGSHERWRTRWAGHVGPIPAGDVLAASTPLGWLGPVAVAAGASVVEMTGHDGADVAPVDPPRDDASVGRLARLADLMPLEPAPLTNDVAADVIARLSFAYPYAAYVRAAAAESVTARAHAGDATITATPTEPRTLPIVTLPQPRFTAESELFGATDIGTATHAVLEHFDFAAGAPDVAHQIASFVDRKLITVAQAGCVDVATIDWLLASRVGTVLREHAGHLRRELPVYFAAPVRDAPPSDDPRDRVMVRGRLDLYVPTPDRDYIVDYKTDRVTGDALAHRIDAYRAQMSAYADALEAVTGKRAVVWLVFLSQWTVIDVSKDT